MNKGTSCQDGPCGDRLPPGFLERYTISDDLSDGTLVWLETEVRNGEHHLMEQVKRIIGASNRLGIGRTIGVLMGGMGTGRVYPEAFEFGVSTVHHYRSEIFDVFDPERYVLATAMISDRTHPMLVIFPSSDNGNAAAAFLRSRSMDVDACEDIRWQGDSFLCKNEGKDITVEGRLPRYVLMDASSLPMPDKEKGRKGTVQVHSVRPEQVTLSYYSENRHDLSL